MTTRPSPPGTPNDTPLALFDIEPRPDAPRCPRCPRPRRWNRAQQQWAAYCDGKVCSNPERYCKACGSLFQRRIGQAGDLYCSDACKRRGPARAEPPEPPSIQCAWCETWERRRPSRGAWPWICDPCLAPIRHVRARLLLHHVPAERARKLTADPMCESCGTVNLLQPGRHGKRWYTAMLNVDHDRSHPGCEGDYSCGRCVRGFVCPECNTAEGALREAIRAERFAAYVRRWEDQRPW